MGGANHNQEKNGVNIDSEREVTIGGSVVGRDQITVVEAPKRPGVYFDLGRFLSCSIVMAVTTVVGLGWTFTYAIGPGSGGAPTDFALSGILFCALIIVAAVLFWPFKRKPPR